MRPLLPLLLFGALALASVALAQEDQPASPDTQPASQDAPPAEDAQPAGPQLAPSQAVLWACDPSSTSMRYLEVRGSGFDPWARQRLVGSVVDASGTLVVNWNSVWVTPSGGLTLELNLCTDPFRGRAALAPGSYTFAVGSGRGDTIATTSVDLSSPSDVPADTASRPRPLAEVTPTEIVVAPLPTMAVAPARSAPPVSVPGLAPLTTQPTATPTTAAPTGPGSLQQPLPLGAPGTLVDGWQVQVSGVTQDAFAGIQRDIPSARVPASDQREFMVRVQATYRGDGTSLFTGVRLALVSASGTRYTQVQNSCGMVPDTVPATLVTSGGVVRGNVCFTVRASDIDSLVLYDNQGLEADRIYFALR